MGFLRRRRQRKADEESQNKETRNEEARNEEARNEEAPPDNAPSPSPAQAPSPAVNIPPETNLETTQLPARKVAPIAFSRFPNVRKQPSNHSSTQHSRRSSNPSSRLFDPDHFRRLIRRKPKSASAHSQLSDIEQFSDTDITPPSSHYAAATADPVRKASTAGLYSLTAVDYQPGDMITDSHLTFCIPSPFVAARMADGFFLFSGPCIGFIRAVPSATAISSLAEPSRLNVMSTVTIRSTPVWTANREATVEYVSHGGGGWGVALFDRSYDGAVVLALCGPVEFRDVVKKGVDSLRGSARLLKVPKVNVDVADVKVPVGGGETWSVPKHDFNCAIQ